MPFIAVALLLSPAPTATPRFVLSGAPVKFVSLSLPHGCRRALPKLARLCTAKRHGQKNNIKAAFADFNRDGLEDIVVRFSVPYECGSGGCATEIYLAQPNGRFRRAELWLWTDGPVVPCRMFGRAGIAFPGAGPNFACFSLQ